MSAYICDRLHIIYLVDAAMQSDSSWYHEGNWHEIEKGDKERAAEIANMLWRENIASVSHRYPNESSASLPGPVDHETIDAADFNGIRWLTFVPVQVAKACQCYEYQSCEHDAWDESEAKAFIEALREAQWRRIPSYNGAEWGAPAVYANAKNVVCLTDLMKR